MTNNKEKFEGDNMNSKENKELTQRQAEAAVNPEEAKDSKDAAVRNVAEAADKEVKLTAEQQAQKEGTTHEGHLMPDRLDFNQYDNTADQYDKAKGTPAEPDLRETVEGPIVDREGSIVDTGYSADGGQANTVNPQNDEFSTGEPEEDEDEEKPIKTQTESKSSRKNSK